jgi:hypothetical protein
MFILCKLILLVFLIKIILLFKIGRNAGYVMNRTVTLKYPDCISEGHIMHYHPVYLYFYSHHHVEK